MCEYCKVLIVDDEFIMRQGMKHMLEWEKEGFQIVGEASNGQEGLDLVEELKPHIILADIVMPVVDGIEFSAIIGRKYPSIQLIILSSYDKFEYVKTTLLNGASDYILKPTLNPDILSKVLKKAVSRIPGLQLRTEQEIPYTNQIEKVLLGYKDKLDEAVFANIFPNTLYRILGVELRNICGKKKDELFQVKQIIENYYEEKQQYHSLPVFIGEGIECMVMNYRVKDEAEVVMDAERIAGRIQRLYPRAFFVMSRSFSNMQEIRKHYQQDISREIYNSFYHSGKYLYITKRYTEEEEMKRFEFEDYTRNLNQRHYEEALQMFEAYSDYLCEKRMGEDRLKNLTKNLIYNYLMEIEKYAIESEDLKEKYFTAIDETASEQEFCRIIKKIAREIRAVLKKIRGTDDFRIVEIKQYVAKHYKEPMELSDIAERFNFSYNYISSYFNQTTKEGFSEYLNKVRIEHACGLLKEGALSISEVGASVGYADHSYFCRVFKKVAGETPSSYRKRMKQGEINE